MMLRVDIHVHTAYSDGRGTVRQVLDAAGARGLDGIAITDHDTLHGYLEARSYSGNLLVLPGYEVVTDAGHVLVLGLEELPPRVGRAEYEGLVGWARGKGGLVVLAHPAAGRLRLSRWARCKPDAVEVMNASYPTSRYFARKGLEVAERLGVPGVGGSDAHLPREVGNAYTIAEVDGRDYGEFIGAVRRGSVRFDGRLSPAFTRFRVGLGYLLSKFL